MAVDRAIVFETQFFKDYAGPQHALSGLFGFARHFESDLTTHHFDKLTGAVV